MKTKINCFKCGKKLKKLGLKHRCNFLRKFLYGPTTFLTVLLIVIIVTLIPYSKWFLIVLFFLPMIDDLIIKKLFEKY